MASWSCQNVRPLGICEKIWIFAWKDAVDDMESVTKSTKSKTSRHGPFLDVTSLTRHFLIRQSIKWTSIRQPLFVHKMPLTCSSAQHVTESNTCTEKHAVEQCQTVNMILTCQHDGFNKSPCIMSMSIHDKTSDCHPCKEWVPVGIAATESMLFQFFSNWRGIGLTIHAGLLFQWLSCPCLSQIKFQKQPQGKFLCHRLEVWSLFTSSTEWIWHHKMHCLCQEQWEKANFCHFLFCWWAIVRNKEQLLKSEQEQLLTISKSALIDSQWIAKFLMSNGKKRAIGSNCSWAKSANRSNCTEFVSQKSACPQNCSAHLQFFCNFPVLQNFGIQLNSTAMSTHCNGIAQLACFWLAMAMCENCLLIPMADLTPSGCHLLPWPLMKRRNSCQSGITYPSRNNAVLCSSIYGSQASELNCSWSTVVWLVNFVFVLKDNVRKNFVSHLVKWKMFSIESYCDCSIPALN